MKKANTRNHLKSNNDIKSNYNSDENLTKMNGNTNTNSNNSYFNNILNSNKDDIIGKKLNLCYTKSLNYLKRKIDNNIKSMFISNIKNKISKNINNQSNILSSDKKAKKNTSYKNEEEFNVNKRNNTSVGCSPKNNIYNNIFILTNIINEKKKKKHIFKNNISPNLSYNINKNYSFTGNNINYFNSNNNKLNVTTNNINSNIKDSKKIFSKKKLLKKSSPEDIKYCAEFSKNKINIDKILSYENERNNKNSKNQSYYYYDKHSKNINSVGYNSIFSQIKKTPKDISKIKTNYMNNNNNNNTNIKIKSFNGKKKENLIRYNSNNNIISSKNKIIIRNNKIPEDENEHDSQYKYQLLKKLEINEFFKNLKSNKIKKRIIPIKTENYYIANCNTSYNIKNKNVNTSLNEKKIEDYYNCNNNNYKYNNKKKLDLELHNYMSSRIIKNNNNKYFCSRNFNKMDNDKEKTENIKSSHGKITNLQKAYINNKTLNLDNKKIIMKKEPKILISPIMQKNKKDLDVIKCNELNKNENINYMNKKMNHNINNYNYRI